MIVRTGEDSPQERYWQDAAASITTGMILHVCYAAAAEKRVASLADLARVFTTPGMSFRDTLKGLESYQNVGRWKWLPGTLWAYGLNAVSAREHQAPDFDGALIIVRPR